MHHAEEEEIFMEEDKGGDTHYWGREARRVVGMQLAQALVQKHPEMCSSAS